MTDHGPHAKAHRCTWCMAIIGLVLAALVAGPSLVVFAAVASLFDLDGAAALTVVLVGTVAVASVGVWLLAPAVERSAERVVGWLRG